MNLKQIESWLKMMEIKNYTISKDGIVDVDGNVHLYDKNLTSILVQFGEVTGSFYCDHNKLTSLEGCPREVGGAFLCHHTDLTSLNGCPREVGRNFYCHYNKLTSLKHLPRIKGELICDSYLHNDPEYLQWKLHWNLKKYV